MMARTFLSLSRRWKVNSSDVVDDESVGNKGMASTNCCSFEEKVRDNYLSVEAHGTFPSSNG
jgi:hypothetical protein